ncbi:MAG TPA: glycosyltransferase, partial [Thermoanaerobaculia bacterium]|nr:glycosyltransferase [Thermoanaerobaculia bacterium]
TMLRLIGWIIGDSFLRPATLFKSLAVLPKSAYLASILPAHGVSHLHAHFATHPATMALIISILSGLPFSFTVHAHDIFVDRSLLRRKVREATFIRSISRFNQFFLERLYPLDARAKIATVHVGIDPSYYGRQAPEATAAGRPTILAVAALKPYKGLVYLIRAASLLAAEGIDFRAEIIGAGPLEADLRAEIARCGAGDRVVLRGALPQDEVAAAIASCDLFVQPSIIAADGQMEGIPVALMEAMAARRPVIATPLSGVPELVEDRVSGLLVDPANSETLAAAMRELLGSPELRSRLGAAGRAKVEREFSIRETVETLGRLLDRHNPPLPLEELQPAAAAIPDARWGLRRLHRRADSRVLELIASTPAGPAEIIVKQHLSRRGESRPAAERAAGEYAMLRTLHGALHGKSHDGRMLDVPAPIAHDAGSATIVIERAHGTPMDAMIRRARRDRAASDTLAAAARAAGAWLRELQRSAPPREERHAIEDVLRRGERDARLAGLSRRKARNARRTMEALAGELFARGRIAVPHHGDFWPGNVFVDAQRVEVIDFEGFRFGLPAEDLAYFLVHARLYLAFRRPELIGIVEREFLSGYGGEVDERELRLARLGCALQLLARSRSGAPFLHQALRRAILRKELAR